MSADQRKATLDPDAPAPRRAGRKVNPYVLEETVYMLGGVVQHGLIHTKVA
jgi:hypothetical protein